MKFNSADFPVEKQPIYASEAGVAYDEPLPHLEETWNHLAEYYTAKAVESNSKLFKESEFYRLLAQARVENETALTAINLTQQGILRPYKIKWFPPQPLSIRPFIVSELRRLLQKRAAELLANMEDEQDVYRQILEIRQEVQFEDGIIKIYTEDGHFVEFGRIPPRSDDRPSFLSCKIACGGFSLRGCRPVTGQGGLNVYDEINEQYVAKTMVQKYHRKDVMIEITTDESQEAHPLCLAVLSELRGGTPLRALHERIVTGLSRCLLDSLLGSLESEEAVRIVETDGPKCCDGRSAVFFAMTDGHVYRVERTADSFRIYVDGQAVRFKNAPC